ncbi:hypothetical protein ACWEVD_23815 [Nocardia thailandica]
MFRVLTDGDLGVVRSVTDRDLGGAVTVGGVMTVGAVGIRGVVGGVGGSDVGPVVDEAVGTVGAASAGSVTDEVMARCAAVISRRERAW